MSGILTLLVYVKQGSILTPKLIFQAILSLRCRNRQGGGVAILSSRNFTTSAISCDPVLPLCRVHGVEIVAVSVNDTTKCNVFSLYCPPGSKITESDFWSVLLSWFSSFSCCLVCGDFNAHSPLWGGTSVRSDPAGRLIESAIDTTNLICLNDGSPTWRSPSRGLQSSPDITLADATFAYCSQWFADPDTYGSDHSPILIDHQLSSCARSGCRPAIVTGRIDWEMYAEATECALDKILPSANPVDGYNSMVRPIIDSAKIAGARARLEKFRQRRRSPAIWWDAECSRLIRLRAEAFHKYLSCPSNVNFINYRNIHKDVHLKLRAKKREKFRDFCSSLNLNSNLSRVWGTIRAFKARTNINKSLAPEAVVGERISRAFNYISITELNDPAPTQATQSYSCSPSLSFDNPEWAIHPVPSSRVIPPRFFSTLLQSFSEEEFNVAVAKLKTKSASGPDLISNSLIKHLSASSINAVRRNFNLMFHRGIYPPTWRETFVIFIPKPDGLSFRPISLANCLMKVFESLVKTRLEWACERYGLISRFQFGFRRGLSCLDNINILRVDIELQRSRGLMIGVIFLDIAGAFDNVLPSLLFKILKGIGVPAKLIRFVEHITSQRIVEGFLGGTSLGKRIASRGLPQGLVLSPMLFDLYLSALVKGLPPDVKSLMYADDICLYTYDTSIENIIGRLNSTLSTLNNSLKW